MGVVLACNNFKVIDLGVMVDCNTILTEAKKHNVDIIGLSGLITPSLDEMVWVAKEMKKNGLDIPLMIGGATTSKAHAAVKIAPHYSSKEHPVVHVLDASRAVVVAGALLHNETKVRDEYVEDVLEEYDEVREDYYDGLEDKVLVSFEDAKEKKLKIDWTIAPPAPRPNVVGINVENNFDLNVLRKYIDWKPFFHTFQLRGRYPNRGFPKIFNDERVGEEAKKLYADANKMLDEIVEKKLMDARAVYGMFPAQATENGEDVDVWRTEEARDASCPPDFTFRMLRQQLKKENDNEPYLSCADFIAPKSAGADYMGAMAVGVFGAEAMCKAFEDDLDDFKSILASALADRLAEALAEVIHEKIRRKTWGYSQNEDMDTKDLLSVSYTGIRPAPGYPSQPDHHEKLTMWSLLEVEERIGMTLSSSLAMLPASAVSAIIFAHPQSKYFAVGSVDEVQVKDYAARKRADVAVVQKSLSTILSYDVSD